MKLRIANMAWQLAGNATLLPWVCIGVDVVLIQEGLVRKDGKNLPDDLSKYLPEGWAIYQVLTDAGRAGSAVCWNTATMESVGLGNQVLLAPGQKAHGDVPGFQNRYLTIQPLREKATGDEREYASCHAPLRKTGEQDIFYRNLHVWTDHHPHAVIGLDMNAKPEYVGQRLGRHVVGREVIGLIVPVGVPVPTLPTPTHATESDHPVVEVDMVLPSAAPKPKPPTPTKPKEPRMATSQNGYPVLFDNRTTGTLPRLRKTVIPDTGRHLYLRDGSVALVLADFALWYHENVERIDNKVWDEWGWAVRAVRGQSSGYSNHASGTAIDINATMHPLAKRLTYNRAQYAKIRAQIKTYDGCLRHGIDYRTRPDEMHVEINAPLAKVELVAQRLINTPRGMRILAANPGLLQVVMQGQQPVPAPKPLVKPTKAEQVLRVGSKGPAVKALQVGLNKMFPSYSHLDTDGEFGPKTKSVIAEFQRRSHFKPGDVNGIVGPVTRKALNKNGVKF